MIDSHDEALVLLSGSGSEVELRAARDHVRACASCQANLGAFEKAIDALEAGTVGRAIAKPSTGALFRLMERVKQTSRLDYFVPELMELYDLSNESARALLLEAERAASWEPGPSPGIWLWPVAPGPRLGDAVTALVRLEPGATFPHHEHVGPERVLVLEGGYTDSTGVEVWRGEVQTMTPASAHGFTAFADVGCVCASRMLLEPNE